MAGRSRDARPARADAVDDREFDLLLGRVEVDEQLVAGVHDLGDPGVGPVDLVDHEDDGKPGLQRLAEHEPGLRQRPLARVHQQHDAVHHGQPALDLAAKVRVPGRVDDVDDEPVVMHRGVLGQDRDALLPLQVAGIHHPLGNVRSGAERTGLPQHGVHQRGLAMVDMRDDRDVPDLVAGRADPRLAGGRSGLDITCGGSRGNLARFCAGRYPRDAAAWLVYAAPGWRGTGTRRGGGNALVPRAPGDGTPRFPVAFLLDEGLREGCRAPRGALAAVRASAHAP